MIRVYSANFTKEDYQAVMKAIDYCEQQAEQMVES